MICPACKSITPPLQYCCSCHAALPQRLFDPNTTVQEIWQRCDKSLSTSTKCPKTVEGYRTAAKKLAPYSFAPIALLTKDDYQDLLDLYSFQSCSTQHELRQVIRMICAEAMSLGLIFQNPAQGLVLNGYTSSQPPIFTFSQIRAIKQIANAKEHTRERQVARIVLILICTGFRPNELFAVRRENVDPSAGYIVSGSKTAAGKNRCVPVIPFIASYMTEFYMSTAPGDYVFRSPSNSKINIRNFRVREFYPLLAKLGFNAPYQYPMHHYEPLYKLYSCRHTFASMAYECGVKPELLIKIMGHTSFDFTMSKYVHPDFLLVKDELKKLEQLLPNSVSAQTIAL